VYRLKIKTIPLYTPLKIKIKFNGGKILEI